MAGWFGCAPDNYDSGDNQPDGYGARLRGLVGPGTSRDAVAGVQGRLQGAEHGPLDHELPV